MNIEKSKFTGFCYGVKNAVDKAIIELESNCEKQIYSYGEIIHNKDVVEKLHDKGMKISNNLEELDSLSSKVLVRSHGVSKAIIEELEKKNIEIIDATCVKVSNIHKIVSAKKQEGFEIIITGDKNHPEVMGILGWCSNEALIIESLDEFMNLDIDLSKQYCVVSQTTFNKKIFDTIVNFIKEKYQNIKIYDTICNATKLRQDACVSLSKKSDVMLIIGGKNSSNTKKLYELSKEFCKNTFYIENYKEIPYNYIDKNTNVGISAGASTPDWIIEEVIKMLENLNTNTGENEQNNTMHELFENYGGVSYIRTGEVIKGTVIHVTPNAISVNLNYKSDGIISREDYSFDEIEDLTTVVKEGDEIEAKVIRIADQDGNVVLTRKPLEEENLWKKLDELKEKDEIIETTVIEASQYGINAKVLGIKGFIPKNHISVLRDVEPTDYLGKKIKVKILETSSKKGKRQGRQLILSSRVVEKIEKEKREQQAWETIEEGEVYEGIVKNIQDYGAFVEVNGVDGLLHINEIAWTRIKHPSEVLNSGDKISVKVKSIDKENKKLSLSYKATIKSPWASFVEKYKKDDIVDGKVSRIVDFGAFVLVDGIECLLHIKDIDWGRTEKVSDVLKEGQDVRAKILNISKKDKKVGLGIKQLVDHPFDVHTKGINKGDIIKVEVTRIVLDGAYVKVNEGIDSFIPLARISSEKLRTPAQVVKIGEVKDAKVLDIDSKVKLISLTFILEEKEDEQNDVVASYKSDDSEFTIGEAFQGLKDLL